MSNIIGLLDIGRRAILQHQTAIQVTGHNIANANSEGYSRQKAVLEAAIPISLSPGQVGSGVETTEIKRIYDKFLTAQVNSEKHGLGRWEAQRKGLERAEIVFDEPSGFGLSQAMADFWNAWQDLTNNPSGHTERVNLLAKSQNMTSSFNKISSDLMRQQEDLDTSIVGTVNEINNITGKIAELNQKITETEVTGLKANDYRDQRDLLLKDLAEKIDFDSFEDNYGKVAVFAGNGRTLVDDSFSWNLTTQTNINGHEDIMWIDGDGNLNNITAEIDSGQLKGWLEVRDVAIDDYLTRLDDLASTMITQVNALHTNGFDLNGTAGIDYFSGTSAFDIDVNVNIANDVNLIAAATTAAGVPGDNSNALAIANLNNGLFMSAGTATFHDYYNSLSSDVGSGVGEAIQYYDHQHAMSRNVDNIRESVSGVSLDEEMMNLVKFQHAYTAAAKLVTKVDELIATVMDMGR